MLFHKKILFLLFFLFFLSDWAKKKKRKQKNSTKKKMKKILTILFYSSKVLHQCVHFHIKFHSLRKKYTISNLKINYKSKHQRCTFLFSIIKNT